MASTPADPVVSLSEEEVDDLLYCARAGDLEELQTTITTLSQANSASAAAITFSAIDTSTKNTCLHYAAANGHKDIVSYLISRSGPDCEAFIVKSNAAGNTALHYAALNGHLDVAKQLVAIVGEERRSGYVSQKNAAGHDAAYEAEGNGKEDVVTYLLEVMDEADATAAGSSTNGKVGEGENEAEDGDDVDDTAEDMETMTLRAGEI